MKIVVGDGFAANVPLYHIIGSKGDIISVGIYETNKNKR